ncbi:hypothetical protein G6F25_010728 [Rhizopus arrhizus]|nr:hypothetical protein G6F25_010728 [Rhizopus arrhizus]
MSDLLTTPFSFDDSLQASTRSPHSSSPGSDGLPYEALSFLFRFEPLQSLVLDVYNQALESAIFPASWTITSTVLLPKKGNLNLLSNWRPISLINTDAKIFTRLLTGRMRLSCSKIIHRVQKGFMPGRFTGDNGLLMQLVKTEAEQRQSTEVGLLLDQEMAYDRVNPEYLKQVLLKFGFPSTIVQIIDKLFFETQIQINVNGFFTSSLQQTRGLRQGDPLSPLLFNIAFDPFLRSIESDNELQGFQFRQAANPADLHIVPPPPIKILAYADDVAVFLSKPSDFVRLRQLYEVYAQASNAKINLGKTEAFSLSGHPHPPWQTFLQVNQISSWHDKNSPSALRYLGFAVCSSLTQRDGFISALWLKIQHECNIHSQRTLSFRGRVTVMNTLIYSKLWHVLRLLSVPKAALQRFSSLAYQFVIQKTFPKFKYDLLLTDRQCGGLKLLDPNKQQLVLQWKWLCPLLLSHQSDSVSLQVQYLSYSLQHHFHAVDPLLLLLFPHCRKGPLGQNNNLDVFTNFFCTMDPFQRSYQDVNLSPASCLALPLASIYTFMAPHSTEPQPPSELDPAFARLSVSHWPKVQVSEAYSFDGLFHRKQ